MRCNSLALYAQLSDEFAAPHRSCLIAPDTSVAPQYVESITSYIARLETVKDLMIAEPYCFYLWPLTKLTNKLIFLRENNTYSVN